MQGRCAASRSLDARLPGIAEARVSSRAVSPLWIWMQVAIVAFVLAGAIIAIVKLA